MFLDRSSGLGSKDTARPKQPRREGGDGGSTAISFSSLSSPSGDTIDQTQPEGTGQGNPLMPSCRPATWAKDRGRWRVEPEGQAERCSTNDVLRKERPRGFWVCLEV